MSLDREDQDDDLLTKLLRDTAPDPIPDEGFADTIMTRLPPRRPRPHRAVWLGLASGIGLAAWQLQGNPLLSQLSHDWAGGQFSIGSALVLAAVMMTALCASSGVLTK